jgi:hypothetical protein
MQIVHVKITQQTKGESEIINDSISGSSKVHEDSEEAKNKKHACLSASTNGSYSAICIEQASLFNQYWLINHKIYLTYLFSEVQFTHNTMLTGSFLTMTKFHMTDK